MAFFFIMHSRFFLFSSLIPAFSRHKPGEGRDEGHRLTRQLNYSPNSFTALLLITFVYHLALSLGMRCWVL